MCPDHMSRAGEVRWLATERGGLPPLTIPYSNHKPRVDLPLYTILLAIKFEQGAKSSPNGIFLRCKPPDEVCRKD